MTTQHPLSPPLVQAALLPPNPPLSLEDLKRLLQPCSKRALRDIVAALYIIVQSDNPGFSGVAKIIGKATAKQCQRKRREHEREESSFAVVIGKCPLEGRRPEFRAAGALSRRQPRQAGLFMLGHDILLVISGFLHRSRCDLRHTLQAHSGEVADVCFSPDGKQFVSCCADSSMLKCWSTASGQVIRTLEGHSDVVLGCNFNAGGDCILSNSADRSLKVWCSKTGKLQRTFQGHSEAVICSAFSPCGQRILSGSHDCTLKTWEAATGDVLRTMEFEDVSSFCCDFSPHGLFYLAGFSDFSLKMWSASTHVLQRTFHGHSSCVYASRFSPDGMMILSGSQDNTLRLWDSSTGEQKLTLAGHASAIYDCRFSHDGQTIASVGGTTLALWNTQSGQLLEIVDEHSVPICRCTFSGNGDLASAGSDGMMKLWKMP